MTAKIACFWALALSAAAGAEPAEHLLAEIKPLGLQFILKVPPGGKVVPTPEPRERPTISVRVDDGDIGSIVEARTNAGKVLWSHDFRYNASAPNEFSVQYCAPLNAVMVHYHGYKWDNKSVLLLVTPKNETNGEVQVSEYKTTAKDMMPALQKHRQYDKTFEYWITPYDFKGDLVMFSCIPLAKNEAAAHPFEQNPERWFTIEAKLAADQSMRPVRVIPNRDESK